MGSMGQVLVSVSRLHLWSFGCIFFHLNQPFRSKIPANPPVRVNRSMIAAGYPFALCTFRHLPENASTMPENVRSLIRGSWRQKRAYPVTRTMKIIAQWHYFLEAWESLLPGRNNSGCTGMVMKDISILCSCSMAYRRENAA